MTTIGLPENGLLAAAFAQARLRILIVSPGETSAMSARLRPTATLVTCYPVYFVCNTHLRYIVHASMNARGKQENEQNN
jgi:sortase (surface protein transpeptidase)